MALNTDHIKWFRDSSPYIDAHRGKTFVICLASDALESDNFPKVISDIALLNSLGIKVVVVFGGDHQIRSALASSETPWAINSAQRVTTTAQIETVTSVLGQIYADLSARFSASTPESPAKRRVITTSTGNFVRARPVGIKDGIDHQLSGMVRSINDTAIEHQLTGGSIVLVPSIGYSPSGETFHLDVDIVAREVACTLTADKLIFLTEHGGLFDNDGKLINEIDLSDMKSGDISLGELNQKLLAHCDLACKQGVARCHIISFMTDGALLEELFTRDGCGTQVIGHSYEQIRSASIEDVPGILKLITPLEDSGVLVKRSRELLEAEVHQFVVIERDGLLISCAALYQFDKVGELACLVTHPDYRNGDRGDRLLDAIEKTARAKNLNGLFVLTTQSSHWFTERGFSEISREALPDGKREFYNDQRNSNVLRKSLQD